MDIELLLSPLSTINTQSNVALSTRNWSCYRCRQQEGYYERKCGDQRTTVGELSDQSVPS